MHASKSKMLNEKMKTRNDGRKEGEKEGKMEGKMEGRKEGLDSLRYASNLGKTYIFRC